MNGSARHDSPIVVGGEPRISLLPPEVAAERAGRAVRRVLVAVVFVALVAMGGVVTLVSLDAATAQAALADERARTDDLLRQQGEYSEVRVVANRLETATAARWVGASTEVDWTEYVGSLNATLPTGTTLRAVNVDGSTPLETYVQATTPLQPPRVATLSITARTAELADVAQWLVNLRALPGFADATPNTVTAVDGGGYTVELTLHIDGDAYANRFAAERDE